MEPRILLVGSLVFAAGLAIGATLLGPTRSVERVLNEPVDIEAKVGSNVVVQPPLESARPSFIVNRAGLVSGHLDDVSREWLLDELTRQGVAIPGKTPVVSPASSEADGCLETVEPAPELQTRLVDTIRTGSEPERFAALSHALQIGTDLPADVLVAIFQAGLSDRLDVLAFSAYADSMAADSVSARQALVTGRDSNSAAVRAEADRRLAELDRFERSSIAIASQGIQ